MTLIEVAEHLENIRQYYSNLESERNYRLKNEEVEALSIAIEALRSFPRFKVIDTTTCREPSERLLRKIAKEGGLIKYDIDQFAVCEDGSIILLDDCGRAAYCNNFEFEAVPGEY